MQLSVRDVAELLNVSEKTVYRWINERQLPGYRLSGQYRFNRAELLEWATANKINVSPTIFHEAEAEATHLPELGDALQTGGIFYRLSFALREQEFKALVTAQAGREPLMNTVQRISAALPKPGETKTMMDEAHQHSKAPSESHLRKPREVWR